MLRITIKETTVSTIKYSAMMKWYFMFRKVWAESNANSECIWGWKRVFQWAVCDIVGVWKMAIDAKLHAKSLRKVSDHATARAKRYRDCKKDLQEYNSGKR